MSLEFMDGFDHYVSSPAFQRKWDPTSGNSFTVGTGRYSGQCAEQGGQQLILTSTQLTSQGTRYIGFALKVDGLFSGAHVLAFTDGGVQQVAIVTNTNGSIGVIFDPSGVSTGPTTIGTSATGKMTAGVWHYFEMKITISATVGAFDIHIDGVSIYSATGKNTQATANATSNGIIIDFSASSGNLYLDDLYVLNSSGTVNNTFLGESRILTGLPTADSATNAAWTPSSGTVHYTRVNEADPDTATYVKSQTVGNIDTYPMTTQTNSGVVLGVQNVMTANRDSTGLRSIASTVRRSSTNYVAGNLALLSSQQAMCQIYETDPSTSAAWTIANINAAEFGMKVTV